VVANPEKNDRAGMRSRESSAVGSKLSMEMTVEAVRQTVSAKVVPLPFFNPARKMAVPVI